YDALGGYATANAVLISMPLPGMDSRAHFELALAATNRMLELAPGSVLAHTQKAVALGTVGDWSAAFREMETLRELGVPQSEMVAFPLILLNTGDFHGAIEIYEANLLTDPVNLYSRAFLMVALELTGQRERARREYGIGEE